MAEVLLMICVFVFSFIAGYFLISRVPPLLHTPLMSMTNAVSGMTILGAVSLFAAQADLIDKELGVVAVIMAVFNVVGGFAVTDRMLRMFRKKEQSQ